MSLHSVVVASAITVGDHPTFKLFGLTFNRDTLESTAVAGAIVVILGLLVARGANSRNPTKLQLVFEMLVDWVNKQVEESMGIAVAPFVVPFSVALFFFILVSNWLEVIPSGHNPEYLPAPTADVNLTYALALLVIIPVHILSIRRRGIRGYIAHYFKPFPLFFPINVIEELAKPLTLALRLFGNIFAGGIMILLISRLPIPAVPLGDLAWKLFDMFIGAIQAFIFSLLTILYFGAASTIEHDEPSTAVSHDAVPSTR
ncbi:MAG TPA: F0F1 ATP synthase subunit A [Acidothermaceae bacterium]|jgi:F-type H+-transporting ATPase subunit a